MAMIDVISGGRVISGMVRGVGVETVATNVNPVDNRERFEEARQFIWRMGTTTRGPREYMNPVGYRFQAGEQVSARRNVQPLSKQSFEELEELKENYHIVCGTPGTMLDKLKYLHDRLSMDHLIMYGQESRMSHEATMANIGFFGKEMLPVIRDW